MSNSVVLVTGAARRIGAEIARVLHQAGMNIVIHYHMSQIPAEALCAELNAKRPHSAALLCGDLTRVQELPTLIEKAVEIWDRLDVLINNAAIFYKTPLGAVQESAWDALIATNLKAPFFLAQAAAPYLRKAQGSIVNIGDIHGVKPLRDYSAYCVSKAGLLMLTQSLAKEWGPDIRVNAIALGAIAWPEGENVLSVDDQKRIVAATVLKRHGTPLDIAKTVLYLVRDAEFVTGQILTVDGGRGL